MDIERGFEDRVTNDVELTFQEAFPSLSGLFGHGMQESHFYKGRLQVLRDDA